MKEKNGTFIEGPQPHCHQPQDGSLAKTKIAVQVKANAKANMFKSAGTIVKGVISEHWDEVVLPKQMNMQRNANRYRQKLRPQDPKVLTDVLSYEFMPKDFLQDEISEKQHLFFATQD